VHPLTNLTRKDVPFIFGPEELEAFEVLKESILESPALHRIDYDSDCNVILVIDMFNISTTSILRRSRRHDQQAKSKKREVNYFLL
jgi:hypothetical protein